MQKITPFLWFDGKAEEAMNFYVSHFNNSKVGRVTRCGDGGPGPKGTVMTATFQLEGQEFMALNGGPMFKITPAISFFVNCGTSVEIETLWKRLSDGGSVLMPLDKYPFSPQFGWVQDRFGVSWQLNLAPRTQKITPFLMFVGAQHGKAEAAINAYVSLFENSAVLGIKRYGPGEGGMEGTVQHAVFSLAGQEFMAIDSNGPHPFTFTEAISLFVNCETQEDVDELWETLSDGGEKQRCGWLKDRFGVSWQIIPSILMELMSDRDPVKSKKVMQAVLQMDKIDIQRLKQSIGNP